MLAQIFRMTEDRTGLWVKLVAGCVIALAIIFRLSGLGIESAWIDEAYSINLAEHSIGQIIQGTAADQHPPLYYLLLHIWMQIGDGVTHARLLSALLGSIMVFQVMIFGWVVADERLGIGAALLLSISPLGVWYSQEARQYMLLACLTTASTYVLWQCLHGRHHWLLYWLFSALAIFTQYFAVFIFISHAMIVCVWVYQQRNLRLLSPWALSMVGVGLVFAPWMPTAINQFLHHTMPWISEPAAGQVRDVGLTLILGNGIHALPTIFRWVLLFGLLAIIGWSIYRLWKNSYRTAVGFRFFALWGFIPFIVITLLGIVYPVFQLKQYLMILSPLLLVATAVVMILKQPWNGLFFAGLVLAGGLTLVYQQNVLTKDDWRGAALYIENNLKARDMVYANPAASKLALDLYWNSQLHFDGYPENYDILAGGWEGVPVTPNNVNQQLTTTTRDFKRVWLVEFFSGFWDSNQEIPSWFGAHGKTLEDTSFGKIRLRLYEMNQ